MSESEKVQLDAEVKDQLVDEQKDSENVSINQLKDRLNQVNAESREARKKLAEEKRRNEEEAKKRLAEAGQHKELAEVYRRQAEEAAARETKLKEAFITARISDSVVLEAQKSGCIDPEVLASLIDLKSLPLDESTLNVDKSHVKATIEDMKKQKPYLFKQSAPKVIDATPNKIEKPQSKSIEKMSAKEIEELLFQRFKK